MMIGVILQYPSFLSMTGFLAGYSGVYSPQSRRERGVFEEIDQSPLHHSLFICSIFIIPCSIFDIKKGLR